MVVVKPKEIKDDLEKLFSLSLVWAPLLSLMWYSWVSDCVKQGGSLSIYTSFRLDNYLPGPTSLGESNNPSAPQLWGLFPPINKGGLTSMNLHDLITLMILPIGISRYNEIQYIRYTSEYISKLQIHQHSLLTRKVFSLFHSHQHIWSSFITES